jgi:hypothetical protein
MHKLVKKILLEPLIHFLMLGAGIFFSYLLIAGKAQSEQGKIVITAGELASIREGYISTWQRTPSNEEMDALIRERVREEVYYQEALALGLDKDDIIIRRRLQQKMEFIAHDAAKQHEPTREELSSFLVKHPELFKMETHYSFRQIFLDAARRGKTLKQEIPALVMELNRSGIKTNVHQSGDASLLPSEMLNAGTTEISGQFGKEFTEQLKQLAIGKWAGPLNSPYGLHIVLLDERKEGGTPALADVHDAVVREYDNAMQKEANEKFYQALLKNYSVIIEKSGWAKTN